MAKGVNVEDILGSLPVEQRQEFAKRLKTEAGIEVTFTVAGKRCKRKHRWETAKGKVVAVRLPDSVYGRIKALADAAEVTVSEWCKATLMRGTGIMPDGSIRSHHKGKAMINGKEGANG